MEQINNSERHGYRLRGDIWLKVGNNLSREDVLAYPDLQKKNLIVDIASDQLAEWAIQGSSPTVPGILTLAVGTGDGFFDLQNPPAPTASQTLLEGELARKIFADKTYVNTGTLLPTATRTNIIDLTTTFLEAEAVGPLVEMGLFAGTGALSTNSGTMINYITFSVINKPSTSELSIIWRLTF